MQSIGLVDLLIDELLNDIERRIASQDIVENGEESQNAKDQWTTLLFDWFIYFSLLYYSIDWLIDLFDLFQCLLKYLNYHLISIYLCGFYPDHAIISHVVVIGDSFNIYLSTIKKNVWPGIYEWNNESFSLNMKLKVKT